MGYNKINTEWDSYKLELWGTVPYRSMIHYPVHIFLNMLSIPWLCSALQGSCLQLWQLLNYSRLLTSQGLRELKDSLKLLCLQLASDTLGGAPMKLRMVLRYYSCNRFSLTVLSPFIWDTICALIAECMLCFKPLQFRFSLVKPELHSGCPSVRQYVTLQLAGPM